MSVHKYPAKLICHVCSDSKDIPRKCEKCAKESLQKVWIWTQQIEDYLKKEFPIANYSTLNSFFIGTFIGIDDNQMEYIKNILNNFMRKYINEN